MEIIQNPAALQAQCLEWRGRGERIALVPTMGYYHDGHASLMRRGRSLADKLVVSLFVNPAQFGPNEDLAAYPRDPERDAALAESLGADVLFLPEPEAMYAPEHATWVTVPDLAAGLCGKTRPAHFQGVCTVVLKLFMLAQPSLALFGQKDWQQAAIIKRMAADLNIPVRIETVPIVREADGLALSSRNVYLTPAERAQAPHIHAGLRLAAELADQGETAPERLMAAVRGHWARHMPDAREDYLALVDPDTLQPVRTVAEPTLAAAAVCLGKARLIDNILLHGRMYAG